MKFFLCSKRGMVALVSLLFAFNLVMVIAIPGELHRYQNLADAPTVPVFFKWGLSTTGALLGVGCAIAVWAFYLSPFRKRFTEQGQIYIFGLALGTTAGVILRATIWILGKQPL